MTKLKTAADAMRQAHQAFHKSLEDLREKIAKTQEEIEYLQTAPIPKSEIESRIDGFIEHSREHLSLNGLGSFITPDGRSGDFQFDGDSNALACWLDPVGTRKRLLEAIEKLSLECGPGRAERGRQLKKAQTELLRLERTEEALITEAESLNIGGVFRRPDANPEIVLGIGGEDEQPKPKPVKRVEHHSSGPYDQYGNPISKKKPIRTVADLPADAFGE